MNREFYPFLFLLIAIAVSLPFLASGKISITGMSSSPAMPSVENNRIFAHYQDGKLFVVAEDDQIYNTGYYYDYVQEGWTPFAFVQEEWAFGKAVASFRPSGLRPGTNYVIAYTCSQVAEEMKCGCLSAGDCGHWQTAFFEA